ncbi:MAG: glycine zipper 2TM domain-containing protein [Planctomycetaceae bacterium]|nr:glycine zipper 2TM domain-containing protein [Planctomycetaceae bacterium]
MLQQMVITCAFVLFVGGFATECVEAQIFQSPNQQTLGTRRGAVVGGIIGGVIGAKNDRPLAGIVGGAVVGGLLGREIGRQQDARVYQNAYQPGFGQNYYPSAPGYYDPRFHSGPVYQVPPQNFYGPRQYQQPQPSRIIRHGW